MNNTSKLLKQTKSIRDYTDTPITPEIREYILACACAAPSGGNQQAYTIIAQTPTTMTSKIFIVMTSQFPNRQRRRRSAASTS